MCFTRKLCLSTLDWLIEPNQSMLWFTDKVLLPTNNNQETYNNLNNANHPLYTKIFKRETNRTLITFSVGSSYRSLLSIKDNNDKPTLNNYDKQKSKDAFRLIDHAVSVEL